MKGALIMRYSGILPIFFLCLICSGCNQNETSTEKLDYEETKKMVVDILKSDEGKKAVQDVLSDEKVKSEFIMDQAAIEKTIKETLISDDGKKFWKKAFKDPKFAKAYANSLKTEHETLLKDLTKDPTYRGMIIDILKEPDLQKEFKDLLKTKEMRELSKETLIETMDSPLVKAKIEDILLKAAKELSKENSSKAKEASTETGNKQEEK